MTSLLCNYQVEKISSYHLIALKDYFIFKKFPASFKFKQESVIKIINFIFLYLNQQLFNSYNNYYLSSFIRR